MAVGFEYRALTNWRANLYLRFGTINILEIARPFCEKRPPLNGLEWTMLCFDIFKDEDEEQLMSEKRVTTFDGVIEL